MIAAPIMDVPFSGSRCSTRRQRAEERLFGTWLEIFTSKVFAGFMTCLREQHTTFVVDRAVTVKFDFIDPAAHLLGV